MNSEDVTSWVVGANVRRLREQARDEDGKMLSIKALSALLADNGYQLGDLSLGRIERGTRKASVDDLTALAAALGCTPNDLLSPFATVNPPLSGVTSAFNLQDVNMWLRGEAALRHDDLGKAYLLRAAATGAQIQARVSLLEQPEASADPRLKRDLQGAVNQLKDQRAQQEDRALFHLRASGVLSASQLLIDVPDDLLGDSMRSFSDNG